MTEIWKDIPDYEGLYQVSDLGMVKSLAKTWASGVGTSRTKPDTIMKLSINGHGYCNVNLCKNGKQKNFNVHRLVYETFNGKTYLQIDHIIEGNKLDNRLCNLQAVTNRENTSKYSLNKNKKSKYLGVTWNKALNKWLAQIRINGKNKYLGYFIDEIDASNAYQAKLSELSHP